MTSDSGNEAKVFFHAGNCLNTLDHDLTMYAFEAVSPILTT